MSSTNLKIHSRVLRVFLSSTFRDFAEERDLLVRRVFPELRRRCRERRVELVDVDLRWGITEAEAQQGKVLPICLSEIDRARPYFMGFLGERYGWVPSPEQFDESLVREQPWLEEYRGGKSVTELEVLHGVLNNPDMAGRALFYFRDPACSVGKGADYTSESPEHAARLERLKERIRLSGFPVVERYPAPEALAERVREDLLALLDDEFPEDEVPDALTLQRMRHLAFGASRRGLYLGGEDYFAFLNEAMTKDADSFRPVLISGESGSGKTALIANWVEDYRARYPDAPVIVHHLNASSDAAAPAKMVRRLMEEIAAVTGDELTLKSDPEELIQQLPEGLAAAARHAEKEGRPWLIVLDALDKLSSHEALGWFPNHLPSGVRVVASCLKGGIRERLEQRLNWTPLEVKPFTEKQRGNFIVTFLARFRKSLPEHLVTRVLSHPLSSNPLFLKTLLEELRLFGVHEELEARLEALLGPPPSKGEGEPPTVEDVFEHVLSRVEEDLGESEVKATVEAIWASRNGLTRDELLMIGGLPPARWAEIENALDENLFESSGLFTFGHDYFRKAVEDKYGLKGPVKAAVHLRLAEYFDHVAYEVGVDQRVVEELPWQQEQAGMKEALLETLTDEAIFRWLYDRDEYELLGYWIRSGADVEEAYQMAWIRWNADSEIGDRFEAAIPLGGFLKTAGYCDQFTEELHNLALKHDEQELGAEHRDTLNRISNLGVILSARGDLDGAELHCRQALDARENVLGIDHLDTLASVHNLGSLLNEKGNYEGAKALYCRAVEGYKNALGEEHPDTLNSLNSLGSLLHNQGEYEEAEALYRQALEGYGNTLGLKHPDTQTAANNLGDLLSDKGDFERAEILYRQALAAREQALGPDHPDTIKSINSLGILLSDKGDYTGAERLYRRALDAREKAFGPEHPDTLSSINNLGLLLRHKGDFEGAKTLISRALDGREKVLGCEHPNTLGSLHNLGMLFSDTDDFEGAEVLYHRALEGYENTLGLEHPDTLRSVNNLGDLLRRKADFESAMVYCRRALDGREKVLGPEHPDTLVSLNCLGTLLSDTGDFEGAAALYRQAVEVREKVLGPEHPDTLTSVHSLGILLNDKGDIEGAETLFRRALVSYETAFGLEHPSSLNCVHSLGILLSDKGDFEGAEALFRRAVEGYQIELGPEHPDTLNSVYSLGILLSDKGDDEGAEVLIRQALEGREKTLGPDHLDTLSCMSRLGDVLIDKDDAEGAEALFRRVWEGCEKILGHDHPDTLSSMDDLGGALSAKGDDDGAEALYREAMAGGEKVFGSDHPATLISAYNLACILSRKGEYDEARPLITHIIERQPDFKTAALTDSDFQGLRDFLETL